MSKHIPPRYRADIDGLRAFSIVVVVIYHAFPAAMPGGFIGVDIFFVISGYLITGIILRDSHAGGFSLAGFYRRRIQRILPPLLPVLLFCLVLGYLALLPFEFANLGKHTAAASVFVPNIVFWTESGYFDTHSKLKPLLHLWSLGVEEQFYLLWPLCLVLAARARLATGVVIGSLLLISLLSSILLTGDRAASFFLPQFRVWELLLGGLLAWLQARYPVQPQDLGKPIALVGLILLFFALGLIDRQSSFPGWWALLPTLGATLLIAAGPETPVNRILAQPLLVFIGKISFPLYLWHWPLLSFARIMESGEPSPIVRAGAVLSSILLAWGSYRLLERPLRYHPSVLVPVTLVVCLLALGATGLAVHRLDGLPQRTEQQNTIAVAFYWKELGLHLRDDCSDQLDVPGRCLSDGKRPTVAIVGDSHSTNTFFALAHRYKDRPEGVIRLGRGGCPPLYNVRNSDSGDADTCLETTNGNLAWVAGNEAIDTVYLSSMGPMYLAEGQTRYHMSALKHPGLSDNRAVFATGLQGSIDYLQAAGKEVVLVIDWPAMTVDPKSCVDLPPLRLTPFEAADCSVPRKRHQRRSKIYHEVMTQVLSANPGLKYWDTQALFCRQGRCRGMLQGQPLYRDRSHLTQFGSRYLGEGFRLQQSTTDTRIR